jgi:hypothetical protein
LKKSPKLLPNLFFVKVIHKFTVEKEYSKNGPLLQITTKLPKRQKFAQSGHPVFPQLFHTFLPLLHDSCAKVARWDIFKPKILIWVSFGEPCNGKGWDILWPFGIYCGNLVHALAI